MLSFFVLDNKIYSGHLIGAEYVAFVSCLYAAFFKWMLAFFFVTYIWVSLK